MTLVVWAIAIAAAPVHAQAVNGVVLEDETEAPVDGAMVILMDPDGDVVRRALSDAAGRFTLQADHAGPHLIRIDRIGYQSLTTAPFEVLEDGTFQRVRVPVQAIRLQGLSVEGSTRCELRPEQGSVTARVWEEVRKALEAAAWTLESGMYRYTLLQFERRLDERGRATEEDVQRMRRGWAQAPYVSAPVEELADYGFVRENDDGTMSYFAPDADALLSDAFLDSHCMHLERGQGGMVGLDFEPIRGRRIPDIEGTLWLEAASASLRRIEFHYVNHPVLRNVGDAGGEVSFARMPNGSWVVRDWSIRMPLLAANRSDRGGLPGEPYITGYIVQGGTLRSASDRNGTTVLAAASGTVSGKVVDSLNALPVTGGSVAELDDPVENRSAMIETGGSFILSGLTPGDRRLRVVHPSLDTLALVGPTVRVPSVAGDITSVRLRLPGVAESLREACYGVGDGDSEPRGAIFYGRVRSGVEPAEGAVVRLHWLGASNVVVPVVAAPARESAEPLEWTSDPDREGTVRTRLDDRGVFLVCGLPTGARVAVEAELGDERSDRRELEIVRANEVVVETIQVGPGL